jgi:hypothetical protein
MTKDARSKEYRMALGYQVITREKKEKKKKEEFLKS